jgi:hypothetical protein
MRHGGRLDQGAALLARQMPFLALWRARPLDCFLAALKDRGVDFVDVKLMAKKQILCFKSASRLEQIGDEHSERV